MLVGSDNRRVDHRVFIIGIIRQGLEKILPNAARSPAGKALVGVAPTAKTFRQVAPRNPNTEFPDHRINKETIAEFAVAADRAGAAR